MSILDFIETWMCSVRTIFEAAAVNIRFERSTSERLNPSCALNLRRGAVEADLIVWESGEAELALMEADGSLTQKHFDDIRNPQELAGVLTCMTKVLPLPK